MYKGEFACAISALLVSVEELDEVVKARGRARTQARGESAWTAGYELIEASLRSQNYSRLDHLMRHKLNHDTRKEDLLRCEQCGKT